MSLVEKINDDMKLAMKSQDKERLSVIRMVKSAVQLAKIELKHDLSDEEVVDVLVFPVVLDDVLFAKFILTVAKT